MSWGEGDQQRDMGIKSKSEAEAREIKPEPPRAITLLMKLPKRPLDSLTNFLLCKTSDESKHLSLHARCML